MVMMKSVSYGPVMVAASMAVLAGLAGCVEPVYPGHHREVVSRGYPVYSGVAEYRAPGVVERPERSERPEREHHRGDGEEHHHYQHQWQ